MYIHHDGPPSFPGGHHNVTDTGKWEITVGHTLSMPNCNAYELVKT